MLCGSPHSHPPAIPSVVDTAQTCDLAIPVAPTSEVVLNAEFHQSPVEDLRRLLPRRVIRAVDIQRTTAVEQVVNVEIGLHPMPSATKDLAAADVNLCDARPEQRERRDERNQHGPDATCKWPSE